MNSIGKKLREQAFLKNLYTGLKKSSFRLGLAIDTANYASNYSKHDKQLLIYSSGQVGSVAITNSLESSDFEADSWNIHHLHFLNPQTLKKDEKYNHWYLQQHGHILPHYCASYHIRKQLDAGIKLDSLKIITAIRNPLDAIIAGFFQTLYRSPDTNIESLLAEQQPAALTELNELFLKTKYIEFYLEWLDKEISEVFGIDVYAQPFSHDLGYSIYKDKHPHLLLFRTDLLNTATPKAMDEFLGVKNFKMLKSNTGKVKNYSELYRQFYAQIKLPERWLDTAEQSRFMQHFFTPQEQQEIIAPWRQRLA